MSINEMLCKLVDEGILSAKQADEIITKLEKSREVLQAQPVNRVNFIRVKLDDLSGRKTIIENRLPLVLARVGWRMGQRLWNDMLKKYPDLKNFKVSLWEMRCKIDRDEPGQVADLTSKDGSKRLQLWLE